MASPHSLRQPTHQPGGCTEHALDRNSQDRDFQIQHEESPSLPETEKTMANAFVWWAAKARIKAKFNKVAGSMGSGMNYGMNAAGQMQPADKNQYDVLVDQL